MVIGMALSRARAVAEGRLMCEFADTERDACDSTETMAGLGWGAVRYRLYCWDVVMIASLILDDKAGK